PPPCVSERAFSPTVESTLWVVDPTVEPTERAAPVRAEKNFSGSPWGFDAGRGESVRGDSARAGLCGSGAGGGAAFAFIFCGSTRGRAARDGSHFIQSSL